MRLPRFHLKTLLIAVAIAGAWMALFRAYPMAAVYLVLASFISIPLTIRLRRQAGIEGQQMGVVATVLCFAWTTLFIAPFIVAGLVAVAEQALRFLLIIFYFGD